MDAVEVQSQRLLRVLSFNIYGAGQNDAAPANVFAQTVKAIQSTGADIIALQETRREDHTKNFSRPCVTKDLAAALGYYYHVQDEFEAADTPISDNGILSRFPIVGSTTNDLGIHVAVPWCPDVNVYVFNVHHEDYPYQPYHLLRDDSGASSGSEEEKIRTPQEAAHSAEKTRGRGTKVLIRDITEARNKGADVIFVCGDFNEPSVLDWTPATTAAGMKPAPVFWPATARLLKAGFLDTYRAMHPCPVNKPGFTWPTPKYSMELLQEEVCANSPEEIPSKMLRERIDFVFLWTHAEVDATLLAASVIGEPGPYSDLQIEHWPSDHRAVCVDLTIRLKKLCVVHT